MENTKKIIRVTESQLKGYIKHMNEDWGGSDQHGMNQSIHKDLGSPTTFPSPFSPEFESAVEDAVDFYWNEWPEYQTDKEGLIDKAKKRYYKTFFPEQFEGFMKMFSEKDGDEVEDDGTEKAIADYETMQANKYATPNMDDVESGAIREENYEEFELNGRPVDVSDMDIVGPSSPDGESSVENLYYFDNNEELTPEESEEFKRKYKNYFNDMLGQRGDDILASRLGEVKKEDSFMKMRAGTKGEVFETDEKLNEAINRFKKIINY